MAKQKLTFRQRLRADAGDKLKAIGDDALDAVTKVLDEYEVGSVLDPMDVMHLVSGNQIRTLTEKLVTLLANAKEAELEKLYNDQLALPGVKDD